MVSGNRLPHAPTGNSPSIRHAQSRNTAKNLSSGSQNLDKLLQGLRAGDNVVWQVERLDEYSQYAELFAQQSFADGRSCIYLRFGPHPPVVKAHAKMTTIELDPTPGFDFFSGRVHELIDSNVKGTYFIFDNISALVEQWSTDELLADFYQVISSHILEMEDVAYFALTRGQHAHNIVARIRDTTQILIDIYHVEDKTYIHPLKVQGRYSPQMFLPHLMQGKSWSPIIQSGDAATVSSASGRHLVDTVPDSIAPWDSVYRKLLQYREINVDLPEDVAEEIAALKRQFSRMMLGNYKEFTLLSDRYLIADDLFRIRERLIGSGQIGGKAAGMLLARRILLDEQGDIDYSEMLDEHDSFYIGSDVFFSFLVRNNLFKLRLQLARNPELSRDDFIKIEESFLKGQFPEEIIELFRDMLDHYGQAPIIVRSSSLLENTFTSSFAGKYRSEFCANQGNPEERLEAFLRAVKLVFASALNPDVLAYRKRRGLRETDEQMAVLVQRVSGMPYKKYFFPNMAGVAFSRNLYAWTNRIDPKKGMIRLVMGLGTRAVNRVGNDYPRMVAVSHPGLRPEIGAQIAKYSQRNLDVIDLEANRFSTEPLISIIEDDYPNIELMLSSLEDGYMRDFASVKNRQDKPVLTFDRLLKSTPLAKILGSILSSLEAAWGQPIHIEFTARITDEGKVAVNLLQCGLLRLPKTTELDISVPDQLPAERIVFRSERAISAGSVSKIQYIVYIDPEQFDNIASIDAKKSLGRVVGKVNRLLSDRKGKMLLMGPGRWGSNNIDLGVNVSYADIDNTSVLVEIAHERAGYEPEASFGTHFFLDLVEAEIIYIPVYPDKEKSSFNSSFLQDSTNLLPELIPDLDVFKDIVRVIDVPSVTGGAYAHVVVDPNTHSAICFLK